ncbi:MAG: type I restriction endonuclease subunit R [Saprospiraceae bacterium]
MKTDTSEKGLEALIEAHLCSPAVGYEQAFSTDYDRTLCINQKQLFRFLAATQPEKLEIIRKRGAENFLKRLSAQIRKRGIIDVLRKGVKDLDLVVYLYYKQPTSQLNKRASTRYRENIFAVCRQLYYSNSNRNSLDMVVFLNGLPIITLELKNHFTGQNVKHAIKQYQDDRDPKEPLFKLGRCVVHFAVDPDLVYMTTKLAKKDTFFLPFNKGLDNGAGNPLNPNGLKADYLWKETLMKASLSNILENFTQIVEEQDENTGKKKLKLIFPRYHQLRVVMRLLEDALEKGVGQRYLIQHSAGSGKSNSITWLAHQLTELHDESDQNIFDSVIVITDRRVLDKQIRDNIRHFAQVKGVVQPITHGSKQLKEALEEGKKIIITTIQKFPYILDEIGTLGSSQFAILIDEAHSSQSGDTAAKMNVALSNRNKDNIDPLSKAADVVPPYGETEEEDAFDSEDLINAFMEQRRMLKNASYFAFTATPKNKTLEVFGEQQADGKFYPFDLYSMKQAIEEEFILNVLQNYTTYQSFYKINKATEDNPEFDTSRAQKKLKAYVESHPFSIKEKSKIMLDHFHADVKHRIKGKAKAMLVTKSIRNAILYFFAFQDYLKEIRSPYQAIVAFSGKKTVDGIEYDEAKLNGFPGNDIPKEFEKQAYRFLIVANKYQTGFDQPLLHTMYVDKKLRDVQAVQTLSRLNRAHKPDKEDTFVLDFFNTVDDIKASFEPFYTTTILSEETDPNKLNDLQDALDESEIYTEEVIKNFTDLYFKGADREELEPFIDACKLNYDNDLNEDQQVNFLVQAKSFNRTYAFLSKILDFTNPYWERLYWFLKFLIPKIKPTESEDLAKGILEAIELDSYRLSKLTTDNISLIGGEEVAPSPPTMRSGRPEAEMTALEFIIQTFNERFGNIDWMKDDKVRKVIFEELPKQMANDAKHMQTMRNSDRQNARIASDDKVNEMVQDFIFTSTDFYKMFMDNPEFKRQYMDFIFDKVWNQVGGDRVG